MSDMVIDYQRRAELQVLPSKDVLLDEYAGRHLAELPTPAFVVDRAIVKRNCGSMQASATRWGAMFRPHIKTHKTAEGVRLQLSPMTSAIVVSTLMEAWQTVRAGLVQDRTVKDILYGLPTPTAKIAELDALYRNLEPHGATLRLLVDHPEQVAALDAFIDTQTLERRHRWSVFIKVDPGYRRSGVVPRSAEFDRLASATSASRSIDVYGFYCHAGNSYGSKSLPDATSFLSDEVKTVNEAARLWKERSPAGGPFVLSVGSTPTAHAFSTAAMEELRESLQGTLELHAGNYVFHDLQQLATSLIEPEEIAHRILASVVSSYPGRGKNGADEAMVDVGGIGLSKDVGPIAGYGHVVGVVESARREDTPWLYAETGWHLARISQEHGILERLDRSKPDLKIGSTVALIGQHACLIAANHPWYYIVDSDEECGAEEGGGMRVVDIWVPWKGW